MICVIDGCGKKAVGRGWCHKHYKRWQNHGHPINGTLEYGLPGRFWQRVEKTDGCWLWTGICSHSGYGQTKYENGKFVSAHRLAYVLTFGPISDGLFVCHRCDNPKCVRPDHLFLGTHQDNMRDSAIKGRRRGERNGRAKLSENEVLALRAGKVSVQELAKLKNISKSALYSAKRGKNWPYLESSRRAGA